jgi:hypothetical protein
MEHERQRFQIANNLRAKIAKKPLLINSIMGLTELNFDNQDKEALIKDMIEEKETEPKSS